MKILLSVKIVQVRPTAAAAAAIAAPVNEASKASHFVKTIIGVDVHLMSALTGKSTNLIMWSFHTSWIKI